MSDALSAEVVAQLEYLERSFLQPRRFAIDPRGGPDAATRCDFDVVLAGGGLSLFYAAYLASRGRRVAVFDRRPIGVGHREWNISRRELAPLVDSGLFTEQEVAALVVLDYRHGIVRWHGGGTYPVTGVLDSVVDAEPLLTALRDRCVRHGATLLPQHELVGYRVGPGGVAVEVRELATGQRRTLTSELLLDGLGASSPHARFDLVCPTVGGVLTGLDEGEAVNQVDYSIGEILATTEDVEEGQQHVWEGFPGPGKRYTTYLFYYTEPSRLPPRSLQALYERFFRVRARYKAGPAEMEKPTFGFIPAYTRLGDMPASPCDRVLLVGDAAGRHSPLTFCGFGSMVRSFLPVGRAVETALETRRLDRRTLAAAWREPAALQVMGGLTLMMVAGRSRRPQAPGAINQLLDVAFGTLFEQGNEVFGAFVRDEIDFPQFVRFMNRTAERLPGLYDRVFATLTKGELLRYSARLARMGLRI